MLFLSLLIAGAALLSSPFDSTGAVCCQDATLHIRPYYQNLARKLAVKPAFVPTEGNCFELIRSGKRYAELFFEDLRDARDIIEAEVYLFSDDPDGRAVRDSLAARAAEGVPVRYINDNFGNFFDDFFDGRNVFTSFRRRMPKMGIDMHEHTPLWLPDFTYTNPAFRNHRKINLIDRRIAFIGGMNFTEGSISGWGDTQLRITGPAVQCISEIFQKDWNRAGLHRPSYGRTPMQYGGEATDMRGKILQCIADGPDQPAYMMEEVLTWILSHAKEYVWFETPYFLPSGPVLKAMKNAAARGIDVRVIVPLTTDMSSFDPAFHATANKCLKSGIKVIYRKPPFNHSKTLVCDDYVTCVGSSNLDKISLLSLYEVNVLIYDAPTALEHREYLTRAQDGGTVADESLIEYWRKSEGFKRAVLGLINHWL